MKVRPDKIATVDDVRARVTTSTTAVVTEYRGLTVAEISRLRRTLRGLGADYKVLKNTLVRRAIAGTGAEAMSAYLEGPTAIAFVEGDVSAVAKALRDFAREAPKLVVKGGVLDGRPLSVGDLSALADLPSHEVLLAQFAGALAAPLRTLAGLMKAVPQNLAYGLSALIDARGGAPTAAPSEPSATETPAGVEDAAPAASDGVSDEEAPTAEVSEGVTDEVAPTAEAGEGATAPDAASE